MIKAIVVYVISFISICSAEKCFIEKNNGTLYNAMVQHSDKITDLSFFKEYAILTNQHGTTIISKKQVFSFTSVIDSISLKCINQLLAQEKLEVTGTKTLDKLVEELFRLDIMNYLIDPCSEIILSSLDSTAERRLKIMLETYGFTINELCNYSSKTCIDNEKVYLLNGDSAGGIEKMVNPEIKLIFILAKIKGSSFSIQTISANKAKKLIKNE